MNSMEIEELLIDLLLLKLELIEDEPRNNDEVFLLQDLISFYETRYTDG